MLHLKVLAAKHISDHDVRGHVETGERCYNLRYACHCRVVDVAQRLPADVAARVGSPAGPRWGGHLAWARVPARGDARQHLCARRRRIGPVLQLLRGVVCICQRVPGDIGACAYQIFRSTMRTTRYQLLGAHIALGS